MKAVGDQIYFNCFKQQSSVNYFLSSQFQINVKWFSLLQRQVGGHSGRVATLSPPISFLILSLESGIVTHLYRCKIFSSYHKFDIFAEIVISHLSDQINQSKVTARIIFCAVRFVYRLMLMSHQICAIITDIFQ